MDTTPPKPADAKADVSVILIVRNGAATIGEALSSVTRSKTQPVEILVIDGHSSDATAEIARGYPLVRVVTQTDRGIANAYNQGIAAARADIVAFISHDDIWTDGKLDKQLGFMTAHPDLMFSVGMVEHFLDAPAPPPGFRTELLERRHPGFIMETLMARKATFRHVGLFDPKFSVGEDTDWFARARDAGAVSAVLLDTLVRKRVHSTNSSLNEGNINGLLLRALRGSIARKRAQGAAPDTQS